jgi:hypothetical protein
MVIGICVQAFSKIAHSTLLASTLKNGLSSDIGDIMGKIVTLLGIMFFSFTSFAKDADCTFTLQYDFTVETIGSSPNNKEIKSIVNLQKINDREYFGNIKIPTLSYHGSSGGEKIIGTQNVSVFFVEKTNRVFLDVLVNGIKVGSSGLNETTLVITTGNDANFELSCSVN